MLIIISCAGGEKIIHGLLERITKLLSGPTYFAGIRIHSSWSERGRRSSSVRFACRNMWDKCMRKLRLFSISSPLAPQLPSYVLVLSLSLSLSPVSHLHTDNIAAKQTAHALSSRIKCKNTYIHLLFVLSADPS